jgi:hypothetical protein
LSLSRRSALAIALSALPAPLTLFAAEPRLSATPPFGVPDGVQLGWEKITGEVDTATESLVYSLFVNPARPAIYELAQYRFVRLEGQTRTRLTEKFVWNKYPSGGKGPQCFALETSGQWRMLERGSDEYRSEMGMTMHVYGVHRQLALGR